MENRFLPFAPVSFRRNPERVPRTQVLSLSGSWLLVDNPGVAARLDMRNEGESCGSPKTKQRTQFAKIRTHFDAY